MEGGGTDGGGDRGGRHGLGGGKDGNGGDGGGGEGIWWRRWRCGRWRLWWRMTWIWRWWEDSGWEVVEVEWGGTQRNGFPGGILWPVSKVAELHDGGGCLEDCAGWWR